MNGMHLALGGALLALGACRSYPVDFCEPAGARVRLSDRAALTLPASMPVREIVPAELELAFDAATLERYGMDARQAAELVARGQARIVGSLTLPYGKSAAELRRFALPGALVVRAFTRHETVRCWWPPEGEHVLRFVGAPAGDEIRHPAYWGEKSVAAHTSAQKSAEAGVVIGGALIGFLVLLFIVFQSM